jgi:hypothetical protein
LAGANLTASLLRPDDLLSLQFEFVNLVLDQTQTPTALVRAQVGQPAFVLVRFAPQHISEECVTEDQTGQPTNAVTPPVAAFLAGGSQLAFQVPDSMASLPFTLAGLLGWTELAPSLAPNAITAPPASNPPGFAEPSPEVTFLEVPYRLLLSPDVFTNPPRGTLKCFLT